MLVILPEQHPCQQKENGEIQFIICFLERKHATRKVFLLIYWKSQRLQSNSS